MTTPAHQVVLFGPFRLLVKERSLFEDGKPVRLGSRAIEVLVALVERAGELVTKRELIRTVWPDTVVVEANLTVHIAGLRRALGEGQTAGRYIVNVPGRGYRFVASVSVADRQVLPGRAAVAPALRHNHNLPAHSTRLVGRERIVDELQRRCLAERLVTIVGPGGIGKTAIALVVADGMLAHFRHGVWLIDLSRTTEPRHVPLAVAAALQLDIRSDKPLLGLTGILKGREMLLVLDNCEHVVEEAAALATELLRGVPGLRLLATSREALRAEGEGVYRLPALASPSASSQGIGAAEALAFPAVQLFVERVASIVSDFELDDDEARHACRVCRELDGLPLAIEFAAARADTLGIAGIANALDDRLRLLAARDQGATEPRHRTIRSTLDWSHQLLSEVERQVLRRIAIFPASFDLNSASAVIADGGLDAAAVAETIASLALKSLIVTDIGNSDVRFRLLQTTRAFALAKLGESPDGPPTRRRHAAHFRDLLMGLRDGNIFDPAQLALEIDNIRAALAWAHGPEGDRSLALSITAASAFVWFELALLEECRRWMIQAIDLLHESERGGRLELELQSALGLSARFSGSIDLRIQYALRRTAELADRQGEHDRRLQALSALIWVHHRALDLQGALEIANRAQAIADLLDDPGAHNTSDTMLLLSHFFAGDFGKAITVIERVLGRHVPVEDKPRIRRWRMDDPIYAKCILAQIRWTMGFTEQANRIVRETVEEAQATGLPVLSCLVRTWCANVFFHTADRDSARQFLAELKETSAALGLPMYEATALCLEGLAAATAGQFPAGERLLRRGLDQLQQLRNQSSYMAYLSTFAELLDAVGRSDEGLILAGEALALAKDGWWTPQVMRIKAKLLMSVGVDLAEAERLLLRSIELSQERSALLFELRSTIDLTRLDLQLGRPGDGGDRVKAVYSRFTEGFETPDLVRARKFLEQTGQFVAH
jgi:predicted ATPase/DNA-binding winged helix-turn-helix (wHTH) protein